MSNYIFIETRGPLSSPDTRFVEDAAIGLKKRGHNVTVFLVQNGVMTARRNAKNSPLPQLVEAGITLIADDFSLRERGILSDELSPGVQLSGMAMLVDLLAEENTKSIWQ